jgi:hypothetical protein
MHLMYRSLIVPLSPLLKAAIGLEFEPPEQVISMVPLTARSAPYTLKFPKFMVAVVIEHFGAACAREAFASIQPAAEGPKPSVTPLEFLVHVTVIVPVWSRLAVRFATTGSYDPNASVALLSVQSFATLAVTVNVPLAVAPTAARGAIVPPERRAKTRTLERDRMDMSR